MDTAPRLTGISRWAGCILAGGKGERMGGKDKGLVSYQGYPLALHVARRLAPQVDTVVISANRNQDIYAALGYAVIADRIAGFAGPLAGMHAALCALKSDFEAVLCVPCDSPDIPPDLALRLSQGMNGARAAVASINGVAEPTFVMLRSGEAEAIAGYLARGQRKIATFLNEIDARRIAFDDVPMAFVNFNTSEELREREARLMTPHGS
jgi:molybdopterin-guanine dinucleotide biosynthesis protein A